MRKGDIRGIIGLVFTSIFIVGIFAGFGITFINSVDNARVLSARSEWKTEALMLISRFISDPNCYAYVKTLYRYTNESGTDNFIGARITVPLAVDRNKMILPSGGLNIDRLDNCVRMRSPENKLYFEVTLTQAGSKVSSSNLDPMLYKNHNTLVEVSYPVKIISDDGFSYGTLSVQMSASSEYFQAKVV